MNLNKTGIKLCGLYLSLVSIFPLLASLTDDTKGKVVLWQIGLMPQMYLLYYTGALSWFSNLWWGWTYLILVPPFALFLYFVGVWIEKKSTDD